MRGVSAGLLVLALVSPAAGQGALKPELVALQGTWTLVAIKANGEERRRLVDNEPRLVIKGDRVRYAGEPLATLKVDAETTPKCIDLHFLSPAQDYEGVYKVEKDTLTICVSMPSEGAKERPLDFETKDKEGRRLLVLRREKAGGGDGPAGGMGWLGVQIRKDDDKVAVADVFEGSPAKKAGLKKDDVLLKVGDEEAGDLQGVVRMIQRARPGSELVFLVKRAGKEERIKARIGVFPFQFLLM
jgi:uncharacterized protein (TIGR03067 family)